MPALRAAASTASWSNPDRPDYDRDALFEAALDVADDRFGSREVHRRVTASGTGHERIDHLMARVLERRSEHRSDLPRSTVERDPHDPALRGLQEPWVHLHDRLTEAGLVRADSRCRELPGREELPGERRDVLGRTRRRAGAGSR